MFDVLRHCSWSTRTVRDLNPDAVMFSVACSLVHALSLLMLPPSFLLVHRCPFYLGAWLVLCVCASRLHLPTPFHLRWLKTGL
jgi:hypothetical protein